MSKAPIWAVAAPGARKPRFTREQLAATALAIADADGFAALSMRRVAEALGAGTMTLYYYVRTKEDLLTLVEDALMRETADACEPLPRPWRAAVAKLAGATRATFLRHAWALRTVSGLRVGPNGLRHIEQSLQAVAGLDLPSDDKLELLAIVDDYVFGHCSSWLRRRSLPALDRKTARALDASLRRSLDEGDYPQLRALLGERAPIELFELGSRFTDEPRHFERGLDALLDGLVKRFKIKG